MKHIKYTKSTGETSDRHVYVVSPIQDSMLCIDLTDYTQEQREEYSRLLAKYQKEFTTAVSELGLGNKWRRFKKSGIESE